MNFVDEIATGLVDQVKVSVRATDSVFDQEVKTLIASAIGDMLRCGVSKAVFDAEHEYYYEALAAIVCYCKAYFGGDNPNEEMRWFGNSYRQHVCDLLNSDVNIAAEKSDALE